MSVGLPEVALVVVVAVLLFGPKRIPELARALGRAVREFKKAKESLADDGVTGKAAEDGGTKTP